MGYRGIVSIWDNHHEDFKQLTTWRRGDDGPMSPTSEVWYDILDEELQAGIIFFYSALAFRFSLATILCTTGQ